MGEKSEKHLYTEVGVLSLHSLNSPSCIIVSLHLCKSKDAIQHLKTATIIFTVHCLNKWIKNYKVF